MGGLLVVFAVAVVASLVAWAVVQALRATREPGLGMPPEAPALPPASTEWRPTHRTDADGRTEVAVVRVPLGESAPVLDRQVVDVVLQDDPEWDASFATAMARARERATLLRLEDE